jgi:hypothetical protein
MRFGLKHCRSIRQVWKKPENTPIIVRSYAMTTIVPDDAGDSIVNSIVDVLATAAAFSLPRTCR